MFLLCCFVSIAKLVAQFQDVQNPVPFLILIAWGSIDIIPRWAHLSNKLVFRDKLAWRQWTTRLVIVTDVVGQTPQVAALPYYSSAINIDGRNDARLASPYIYRRVALQLFYNRFRALQIHVCPLRSSQSLYMVRKAIALHRFSIGDRKRIRLQQSCILGNTILNG